MLRLKPAGSVHKAINGRQLMTVFTAGRAVLIAPVPFLKRPPTTIPWPRKEGSSGWDLRWLIIGPKPAGGVHKAILGKQTTAIFKAVGVALTVPESYPKRPPTTIPWPRKEGSSGWDLKRPILRLKPAGSVHKAISGRQLMTVFVEEQAAPIAPASLLKPLMTIMPWPRKGGSHGWVLRRLIIGPKPAGSVREAILGKQTTAIFKAVGVALTAPESYPKPQLITIFWPRKGASSGLDRKRLMLTLKPAGSVHRAINGRQLMTVFTGEKAVHSVLVPFLKRPLTIIP
jgi:hypothetical protein